MKTNKILMMLLMFMVALSCGPDDEAKNNVPVIKAQAYSAKENITLETVIATVAASDADDDALTFSIATNDNNLFAITKDGKLSLAQGKSLDFKNSEVHTIKVAVSDEEDSASANIIINVIDVDDDLIEPNNKPVIETDSFTAAEDIADDYVIGTVVATDEDGDALTFAITEDSSALFEITNGGELSLAAGKILDFESSPNYAITITVSDDEGLSAEATILINVINIVDTLAEDSTSFVTKWQTTMPNEEVIIGSWGANSDFNYIIDWGDGTEQQLNNRSPSHTYEIAGTYTIAIQGQFPGFGYEDGDTEGTDQCIAMEQWGNIEWKDLSYAFANYEMTYNATDTPNLSEVEAVDYMFGPGTLFNNESIADWNVSQMESMDYMFAGSAGNFNQDISSWDVGNVTSMIGMFYEATNFNQDISDWEVGNVANMEGMFALVTNFDKDISGWDVSQVTDMTGMFFGATAFNQDISNWDVGNVQDMLYMFRDAINFNRDIGDWNISNISTMLDMLDNSGLSTSNYGNTLIGWATIEEGEIIPQLIQMNGFGLEYCSNDPDVIAARDILSGDNGWNLNGDTGVICD